MKLLQSNIRKIQTHLYKFRFVEMSAEVLSGVFHFLSLGGGICLIWVAFDNGWHLSNEWRWLGCLTLCGVIALLVRRVWIGCKKLRDFTLLALRLERHNGHEQNELVNAFHFSLLKNISPSSLEAQVIAQTSENISRFRVGRAFSWSALKNKILTPGIVGVGILIYALLWSAYFWNGVSRLVFPWASIAPETRVTIDQDFRDQTLAYGQPFTLDFGIRRGKMNTATLSFKKNGDEGLEEEKILSANEKGRFHFEFSSLRKDLQWQLRVGDFKTLPLKVCVLPPPRIEKRQLSAHYPKELDRADQIFTEFSESMDYPEETELKLELTLDQAVSELKISETGEGIPWISGDKKNWETHFTLKQSLTFEFSYKTESGIVGVLLPVFHFQSVPDLPPRVEWKGDTVSGIFRSAEEKFEIGVCGNDDRGIRSLVLLFRKKGEEKWTVLEESESTGKKEWEKSWALSAERLAGKAGMEFEFQAQLKDVRGNKSQVGDTSILTLSFLSKAELRFLLYGEMLKLFHECRQALVEAYLMAEPVFSSAILSAWEKRLDTLTSWGGKSEDLKSLYFSALPGRLAKASALLKECKRTPSSILVKRWMSEFLGIQMDWESEKRPLLNALLQKAMEEERSQLLVLFEECVKTGAEPESTLASWQDFQSILRGSEYSWGKSADLSLLKTSSHFREKLDALHTEKTLRRVAQLLTARQKDEADSLFQELLSRMDLMLKKGLSDFTPSVASDTWVQKLEKIVNCLERTDERMGLLSLNKSVSVDALTEATAWIEKSIRVQIEEITSLQTAGIQGVTFLSAAQFDLQEMCSWFRSGSVLKAESKRKRVRQNLGACLTLLKKHLKEKPKEPLDTIPRHTPSYERHPPEIHLLKSMTSSLVLSSEGALDLEAVCSDDWGIKEIWLLTRVLDANGAERKKDERLWLELLDFPEKYILRKKLSLSTLGVMNKDTFEVQIKCVDADPDGSKQNVSPVLKMAIRNPSGNVSAEDYFQFKSTVAEVLQKFLEALKFSSQELQSFEKDALQKKATEPSLYDAFVKRQSLLRLRFETFVEKMDLFQKQSTHFPEEDFPGQIQFAKSILRKHFEDWEQETQQAQTILHQSLDDFSLLFSLLFQSQILCKDLQKDFERLLLFFGTPAENKDTGVTIRQKFRDALKTEVPGATEKAERLIQDLQALGQDTLKEKLLLQTVQKTGVFPTQPEELNALDESSMDLWQKISLADHKLQLLEPLFSKLSEMTAWESKDVKYFQNLCSLLSIFCHQFQTLKDQIQNNIKQEEKERQIETAAKIELRSDLLETIITGLETQIKNSAWQFEQKHLSQIQKEITGFLSVGSGSHSAQELSSMLQQERTLWDQAISKLQTTPGTFDPASLEQARTQTQKLLKLFEKSYQNLLPPHFAENLFKNFACMLKALQQQNPNIVLIFFKKLETQFSEFQDILSAFSQSLSSTLYREAQLLQATKTNKAIENVALKVKTIQKQLEALAVILNKTPEQVQEMNILQKQWKEARTEMEMLQKSKTLHSDSERIPRFPFLSKSQESQESAKTKLKFPALDASLEKVSKHTSGEPERLDQTILRNIEEELEELEATRESGKDLSQKTKDLYQRLSKVTSNISGDTLSELKTDLENAKIQNAEKQQKQTLASVLQALQEASENAARKTENKNVPAPPVQEQHFRYLRALEKKKEDWDRVQDRMSRSFLLTEEMQDKIQKHTLTLGQNLKELRQSINIPVFESVKMETNETIRQNETRLLQEADIVLQGRVNTALGTENFAVIQNTPVVGFEILTREYLKVIAGSES